MVWRWRNEPDSRRAIQHKMNSAKTDWASYVDTMAALHGLQLNAELRGEVIRQLERIDTMAQRFVDFPLEAEVELAPVFRP